MRFPLAVLGVYPMTQDKEKESPLEPPLTGEMFEDFVMECVPLQGFAVKNNLKKMMYILSHTREVRSSTVSHKWYC